MLPMQELQQTWRGCKRAQYYDISLISAPILIGFGSNFISYELNKQGSLAKRNKKCA